VDGDGLRWRLAAETDEGRLFPGLGAQRRVGAGEYAGMEFLEVEAKTVINTVPASSHMPFRYTINPYRGCSHACTYCFARPTHSYLGLDIAGDFDRRIVVKVNAVECLRAELASPRWDGSPIAMGTNTDPYQKAEGRYHLTRGIVEALGEAANAFSILTKSTLVLRDLDLLTEAARRTTVRCALSVGTLDRDVWRLTEPGTPPPDKRLEAVRRLNDAGIPTSVLVAPLLPGLSDGDEQVRAVARAAGEAGAVGVTPVALHLRPGVRDHVFAWLRGARPDLVPLYEDRFGGARPRAYQAKAEQDRLTALVASATGPPRRRTRPASPRRAWRTGHELSPSEDGGAARGGRQHEAPAPRPGAGDQPGVQLSLLGEVLAER
jgi:DNA repair photolyase